MRTLLSVVLLCLVSISGAEAVRRHRPYRPFKATAYATHGVTKSGDITKVGVVAADPRVLPLGTKIHVTGAGPYSGVYVVKDTGSKVKGRHIDLYMPRLAAAKEFGAKVVMVTVLEWGAPRTSTSG